MYIHSIALRPVEKNPKIKMTHKVIYGNKKYNDFAYCLNNRLLKTMFNLLDIGCIV